MNRYIKHWHIRLLVCSATVGSVFVYFLIPTAEPLIVVASAVANIAWVTE